MNSLRRSTLKFAAALSAGLLLPLRAIAAWNKDAFGAKTAADALKGLGVGASAESKDIVIDAPQIAENGAVVPIAVATMLTDVTSIAFLASENPNALAAYYVIPEGTVPAVANRLKMAKTCNIIAIVESGGKLYSATKEVKVTVGGCGG